MSKKQSTPPTAAVVTAPEKAPVPESIFTRANTENPDEATRAELGQVLDKCPEVWQTIGDMAARTQERTITAVCGKTHLIQEATRRHVAQMRADLGHTEAPALERTLIEHIITCWLRLQHVELNYNGILSEKNVLLAHFEAWDRRLTIAQARYLRAIETLARVRRLARPGTPLQVNIGGQQVNQVHVTPPIPPPVPD